MKAMGATLTHNWKFTAALGLGALLIAAAALFFGVLRSDAAGTTLGIDVAPDGNNSASSMGDIDTCRRVAADRTFDVDIYVADVSEAQPIQGFDIYITWDPSVLQLASQDTGFMVSGLDASDPVPDNSGRHFLASGAFTSAFGSGVLARVTFQPVTNLGSTAINIKTIAPYGPILSGPNGFIGGNDQDHTFSGPITDGQIVVGQDCTAATPTNTPQPTPAVTPSPPPTPTVPVVWTPTPTPTPIPTPTPTPTPVPTDTPVSTPTATPLCDFLICAQTPTPTAEPASATPGPGGQEEDWGDMNCDGSVTLGDAIFIARYLVGLSSNTSGTCPHIGDAAIQATGGVTIHWGDVDCSQQLGLGDAIILARHLVGLDSQPAGCPQIGASRTLMVP